MSPSSLFFFCWLGLVSLIVVVVVDVFYLFVLLCCFSHVVFVFVRYCFPFSFSIIFAATAVKPNGLYSSYLVCF